MTPLTWRALPVAQRLARMAGWVGIATILVLSLVPGNERPHSGMPGRYEHVAAYALVGASLALGYRGSQTRLLWIGLLMALAGAMEVAQTWVPGRSASVVDAVAGSIGTLIGMATVALATRRAG